MKGSFRLTTKGQPIKSATVSVCLACLLGLPLPALAADADRDGDGIPDAVDNCVDRANTSQRDSDGDGFGNACDADLDNNGFVNSIDFSIFKRRLLSRDADADLNGDGIVNSLDYSMFKRMLLSRPGPSNTVAEPSFEQAPPPVSSVELFQLSSPTDAGQNAAIAMEFKGVSGLKDVISLNFDGKTIAVNDLGVIPDAQAGDGVFSGLLAFDFAQQQKDEELFQRRLNSTKIRQVGLFSGRDKIGQRDFVPLGQAQAISAAAFPLVLPSGIKAVQFIPTFDFTAILPITHDPNRSLTVTAPGVVGDPIRTFDPCDIDGDGSTGNVNGAWSFKTLMTNMANTPLTGVSAQQFTHNWLLQWMSAQTVNSFTINPRPNMQNFFQGWDAINPATLDMNNLPFRLLAIVNRIDLSKTTAYGLSGQPGEIRLVFGLVDPNSPSCTSGNTGATRQMTVIFEYGDTAASCSTIKSRANEWLNLSTLALGSPAYNAALQAITDDVTLANAVPGKPNGSAINQIRTNDIALAAPWQLREFVLTGPNLASATIKQTPDPALFRLGSAVTAQYMDDNADAISCEKHSVPENYLGNPFLGSHTDYGFGTLWNAPAAPLAGPGFCVESPLAGVPSVAGTVRHKLSLNTCDDCHAGETQTAFTHIRPGSFPATLSGFLTGITVPDPVGEPVTREFNDLQRRGQILEDLAVKSCVGGGFLAGPFDPFVLTPPIDPVFKFDPPSIEPVEVDFSRQQQIHTFVH